MNRRDVIIPRVLLAIIVLVLSPYLLALAALAALFCLPYLTLRAARWIRFRAALRFHAPVREDGDPLNAAEAYQFAAIERGWKDRADEPVPNPYQGWLP